MRVWLEIKPIAGKYYVFKEVEVGGAVLEVKLFESEDASKSIQWAVNYSWNLELKKGTYEIKKPIEIRNRVEMRGEK